MVSVSSWLERYKSFVAILCFRDENGLDEELRMQWDELREGILERAKTRPYMERISKVLFRGSTATADRTKAFPFWEARPDLFDLGDPKGPRLSVRDYSQW
jgi:hypothetical protein